MSTLTAYPFYFLYRNNNYTGEKITPGYVIIDMASLPPENLSFSITEVSLRFTCKTNFIPQFSHF